MYQIGSCDFSNGINSKIDQVTKTDRKQIVSSLNSTINPSFIHLDGKYLQCTCETIEGQLTCVDTQLNQILWSVSSYGQLPCHLNTYQSKQLFASNQMGQLTIQKLSDDMSTPPLHLKTIVKEGHGSNPERQEKSHTHECQVSNEKLYVPDLGLDKIWVYSLNEDNFMDELQFLKVEDGDGPRHVIKHNDYIQVICELSFKLRVIEDKTGKQIQEIDILEFNKSTKQEEGTAAAIDIDLTSMNIMVSERMQHNIIIYKLKQDGTLEQKCRLNENGVDGLHPRFCCYDKNGNLIVAYKDSDKIVIYQNSDSNQDKQIVLPTIKQPTCIVSID